MDTEFMLLLLWLFFFTFYLLFKVAAGPFRSNSYRLRVTLSGAVKSFQKFKGCKILGACLGEMQNVWKGLQNQRVIPSKTVTPSLV